MRTQCAADKAFRLKLIFCVVFSMLFSGLGSSAFAGDVIRLRAQSWGGTKYMPRLMMENVLSKLEASGRFKLDYFPGEPLMSAKEAFDGLRQGVLDIAISAAGYHQDRTGAVGAIEWLPRNFDFEKFAAHYRDPAGLMDFVQPTYEKLGLRLMADLHTPPTVLCSTRPVVRLEDMKGILYRDPGGMAAWQKMLGASPLGIPSSELYEGFQRGVVEAHTGSVSSYLSHKWFEVAPYVTFVNWFLGGMQLIMNLDAYNGLPSDARALVDRAVADAEAEFWEMSRKEEKQMIETMKMKGATLIYPSHEEMARWEAAIAPYYAKLGEKYGAEWTQLMNIREKLK